MAALLACPAASAQRPNTNYDEAKVPQYTLPDPLTMRSGRRVRDAETWYKQRRPEVLRLFETEMFGRGAGRPPGMTFELAGIDRQALGGRAIRKQVTVDFFGKKDAPRMTILLYLPAGAKKPVPLVLGLNVPGNQAVHSDPGIKLGEVWVRDQALKTMVKRPAVEKSRGAAAGQWQVEKILARGFGLATIYYCEIEPDFNGGLQHGVRPFFYKPGRTSPAADEWGSIGAWAWGLSRALDYLETDKDVDARRVAVMGHSRLGKTALWAGASDTRFALVISNDSGEGGAALSRRMFGETVKDLNTSFPFWFCENYKKYSEHESDLPWDQHMLLALIAPRPVYVASAQEDLWADPKGEFLSAVAAGPVYRLLGKQDLGAGRMPGIHQPIMHTLGYHIRAGKHDVTAYDWDQYLDFMEMHLKK
jgi:hypothetical protein